MIEGQSKSIKTEPMGKMLLASELRKNAKEPQFHVSDDISVHDREKLEGLLKDHDYVFAKDDFDLGHV